ncbi:MAG: multiheme c-type cytochrome [Deltaproteobacteria bacterium]
MTTPSGTTVRRAALAALGFFLLTVAEISAAPIPTTAEDFRLPGTQPLSLNAEIAAPDACTNCHSDYGHDAVEPYANWAGSMMAQSARDPLTWAAIAIANQDADHSGETCLRCHVPKAWLEGRSTPEDGSEVTAADREGVQCNLCHRLVDPLGVAGAPAEDAAILASLSEPVTTFGNAMMVLDPNDSLRGPSDIITDLGEDPHIPNRTTLISPFHKTADLCGTCHDLRNPIFTRDSEGNYIPNALDEPGDPALGFPEQLTYTEWKLSEFADTGVVDARFGGNAALLTTCQDCHMPDARGRAAKDAPIRDDLPVHTLVGANTFVPKIIPHHPVFGAEVDAALLDLGVEAATDLLRRSADLSARLENGVLHVRVINRTGHKLPTGYPEGRRMWLHIRAFDADDALILESGRYVHATATLLGWGAEPGDTHHDAALTVFESSMGLTQEWADTLGRPAGKSFHLVLNNVILKDNRIPPRGFNVAAFEAAGAGPVGADYQDGEYWADTSYDTPDATRAEVTLYYQTASREYIEFLNDENTTNAAGPILHDLWSEHGRSAPVPMAATVVSDDGAPEAACRKNVGRAHAKHLRSWTKAWGKCLAAEAKGLSCDTASRDARLSQAEAELEDRFGGLKDAKCGGEGLSPLSLGHQTVCPLPCSYAITLHSMSDLAACASCITESFAGAAYAAAYGAAPPELPDLSLSKHAATCQKLIAKSAEKMAQTWAKEISRCEAERAPGDIALDCVSDRAARLAKARLTTEKRLSRCKDWSGLAGCGTEGNASGAALCLEAAVSDTIRGYTSVAYPAGATEGIGR